MPQSLSSVYLHIVFSTKQRIPFLSDNRIRRETHAVMGGIAKRMNCAPVLVGGVADHVHALVYLDREIPHAELIKELKRSSSLWLTRKFPHIRQFAWQAGYGVFSVSASNLENVRGYIERQEEHHRTVSFQDEFRAFLQKHEMAFDERYMWE